MHIVQKGSKIYAKELYKHPAWIDSDATNKDWPSQIATVIVGGTICWLRPVYFALCLAKAEGR